MKRNENMKHTGKVLDLATAASGLKKRIGFLVGLMVVLFVVMRLTSRSGGNWLETIFLSVTAAMIFYVPFRIGFRLAAGFIGKIILSLVIWGACLCLAGFSAGLGCILLACATVADIGWGVFQYVKAKKAQEDAGVVLETSDQAIDGEIPRYGEGA